MIEMNPKDRTQDRHDKLFPALPVYLFLCSFDERFGSRVLLQVITPNYAGGTSVLRTPFYVLEVTPILALLDVHRPFLVGDVRCLLRLLTSSTGN